MQERLDKICSVPYWYLEGRSWSRYFSVDKVMVALARRGCIEMRFSQLIVNRTTVVESDDGGDDAV